jgi:hypothetical protein
MMTIILIGILLLVLVSFMKLNVVKGWFGEKITSAGMWALLDTDKYRRIDDLIGKAMGSDLFIAIKEFLML